MMPTTPDMPPPWYYCHCTGCQSCYSTDADDNRWQKEAPNGSKDVYPCWNTAAKNQARWVNNGQWNFNMLQCRCTPCFQQEQQARRAQQGAQLPQPPPQQGAQLPTAAAAPAGGAATAAAAEPAAAAEGAAAAAEAAAAAATAAAAAATAAAAAAAAPAGGAAAAGSTDGGIEDLIRNLTEELRRLNEVAARGAGPADLQTQVQQLQDDLQKYRHDVGEVIKLNLKMQAIKLTPAS